MPQTSYLKYLFQQIQNSVVLVDEAAAQPALKALEGYIYSMQGHVALMPQLPVAAPAAAPEPPPTPEATLAPALEPATAARTLALTAPIKTDAVTVDAMGCVAYPDTITPAGKITFAGTVTGTFKNIMIAVPGVASWGGAVQDGHGGWTCAMDLSGVRTGPLNCRVMAWYDDPTEMVVNLDFTLLIDNPSVRRAAPAVPAPAAGMKPILVDDFDKLPNDSRWGFGVRADGSQWGSGSHFLTKDEKLSDVFQLPMPSCLRIRAVHDEAYQDPQGWNRKWRSGLLCTAYADGRPPVAAFAKGYVEMRAILPLGKGMWPSMWGQQLGSTPNSMRGDLPNIELDPLEGYSEVADPGHYALGTGAIGWNASPGRNASDPQHFVEPFDASSDWHTYGALIDDMHMTTFLDGVEVDKRALPISGMTAQFFWMFDNALSAGDWPIVVPPAQYVDMWIDYIRIWSAD
jgi:hypothetical protein